MKVDFKTVKIKRSDMITMLCQADYDALCERDILQVLAEGCRGYENFSDEELVDEYTRIFGTGRENFAVVAD